MSDIVERLRKLTTDRYNTFEQAADEIESLRQRVALLEYDMKSGDYETLYAQTVHELAALKQQGVKVGTNWVFQSRDKQRSEIKAYLKKLAALKAVDVNPETMLRLIATIKYMVGIAERGTGKTLPDDVTPEAFVLDYVQSLEALAAAPKPYTPVKTYTGGKPNYCNPEE